ncbi:hypothetical protein DS66_03330 [Mesotoga sp. SC_3PWM13N19]|nr:hypothetical protein DS66_03330 [Mesotoga sp. SC_3PWM13N19]
MCSKKRDSSFWSENLFFVPRQGDRSFNFLNNQELSSEAGPALKDLLVSSALTTTSAVYSV